MGFRPRMLHPDIWTDEDLGALSVYHRLLFMGLFSHSDDEGIVKANPAFLKASVFPYDRISKKRIEEVRNQLVDCLAGVQLYEENGKEYITLLNWNRYQKLKKPSPSIHPKPKYKKKAVPFATRRAIARRHGLAPPVRGWMGPHAEKEVPCHYCGKMGKIVWMTKSWVYFRDLELDHIIPERLGGTGEADNIVLSCRSCNRKRHTGIIKSEPSKNQVGTPIERNGIERNGNKDKSSQKEETTPVSKVIPPCPYKKIAEVWNKMAQAHKLPTVKSIQSRKGAMNTRWRDEFWRENWEIAIGLIPQQAWMLGDNKNNWKANIDYFLRPKTVATIIEAGEVADVQQSQKPFYEKGTKIKALTNRYRGIKVGSKGTVAGCFVSFPGTHGTHQGMAIHQEQIRENPYEWEVMCKKG